MKTAFGTLLSLSFVLTPVAQVSTPVSGPDVFGSSPDPYTVVKRAAHSQVWQRIAIETNALGRVQYRTNAYTELATGLNYFDAATQIWQPSREEWQVYPDGIVAQTGRTKVILATNLNLGGSVDVLTPDGVRLVSNPVGLGFYDPVDGKQVLLAEVKDCVAQRGAAANEIVFRDCFEGMRGSIRYLYTRAGLRQHVVLEQRLELPAGFSDKTRLECYTEFAPGTPLPRAKRTVLRREEDALARTLMVEPDFTDSELGFGKLKMRAGVAFSLGVEPPPRTIRVSKQFENIGGRPVLVEAVEFKQLEPLLAGLAAVETRKTDTLAVNATRRIKRATEQARLSHERFATERAGGELQLASQPLRELAVVIDYELLESDSDFTFQGDTTYYVSGPVYLDGTTTIEGGAVVKSSVTQGDGIVLGDWDGAVVCQTGPYRPAVFTSKHDNSVGQIISGSSGSPAQGDFATAFAVQFEWANVALHDLRIAYATTGLQLEGYWGAQGAYRITDAQILHCQTGLALGMENYPANATSLYLGNMLFYEFESAAIYAWDEDAQIVAEHITAYNPSADGALFAGETGSNFDFYLKNSLLCGLSGLGASVNLVSTPQSVSSSVFQTVGAGACYLADNTHRDQGTTSIDTELAAALKQKTTHPPEVFMNQTWTSDVTLYPRGIRDDDCTPDRGYHYDPIDYAVAGIGIEDELTLTAGTVVASFGSQIGLVVDGGLLVASGGPKNPVRMIRYNCVQEQSGGSWAVINGYDTPTTVGIPYLSQGQAYFEATHWFLMAGNNHHFWDAFGSGQSVFHHCQFSRGTMRIENGSAELFNCLWERAMVWLYEESGPSYFPVHNNTFIGGWFGVLVDSTQAEIHDNLFDRTEIFAQHFYADINHSHNAYVNGYDRILSAATGDVTLADTAYESGPLGKHYLASSSPLIDAGSRSAAAAGLFHHTVGNAQQKEGFSTVDIGFHYVAVDGNENPIDTDGDGLPDYLEDSNGNGLIEVGETPWTATVSVQSSTYPDAWESDEDPGVFTVMRASDSVAVPLTVNVVVSGSATEGTDYPPIGGQVTIPVGMASVEVYLWPFNDGVAEGTETAVMTLAASDTYIVGTPDSATVSIHDGPAPSLDDPKAPGSFSFSSVVYASEGDQKIPLYETPSSGYSIDRRLDISPFYDSVNDGYWIFNSTSVPINGMLSVPTGAGPFPLAIFVHGNHAHNEYSDPGYVYLCELLASHGILAATIDANFLNGSVTGENDARAILHLEHVRQFAIWNATPNHPLYGKVDLNQIMLVGHSRGGEGVGHAGYYNTYSGNDPVPLDGSEGLGPYSFDLKALVAIAPTDGQFQPSEGPTRVKDNYLIIHGSRDGDVSDFQGYKTYDRAHPIDLANPARDANGFKALGWIIGANHNYFNTAWGNDPIFHDPLLTRSEQEDVAKVYISAMAQATLLGQRQYLKFLKNHNVGANWLPSSGAYVSQYQAANRLFINHYEEDTDPETLSPPLSGANTWSAADFSELSFDDWWFWWLYQETHGVRFSWSASSHYYQASFSGAGLNAGGYGHLVLRIGQSHETGNPVDADQDLRIIIQDTTNESASFTVSSLSQLLYPDTWYYTKMVMQTVRIPLNVVKAMGVDVNHIAFVKLVFDQVSDGIVYFDDIQLSN